MKRMAIIHQKLNKGYNLSSLFIIMILCLGACTPKHSSYSEFKDISPEGWQKGIAYEFVPEYRDSLAEYGIDVALCFSHKYSYRNMSVVVDFMKNDSLVDRSILDYELTDANGNWLVSGFGVQYQAVKNAKTHIKPNEFDKIQIYHGLKCDTLNFVNKVGIMFTCH